MAFLRKGPPIKKLAGTVTSKSSVDPSMDSSNDNDDSNLEREVAALECTLCFVSPDNKDQKRKVRRLKTRLNMWLRKVESELNDTRAFQIEKSRDYENQLKELEDRLLSVEMQLRTMVFDEQVRKEIKPEP